MVQEPIDNSKPPPLCPICLRGPCRGGTGCPARYVQIGLGNVQQPVFVRLFDWQIVELLQQSR